MRIYTNENTWSNVQTAAKIAGVQIDYEDSRSFEPRGTMFSAGFIVYLSGNSKRRQNSRGKRDDFAATWDQWGIFLSVLFNVDNDMSVGGMPGSSGCLYKNVADFEHKTGRRFINGQWPEDEHGDHRFQFDKCTKCSAEMVRD